MANQNVQSIEIKNPGSFQAPGSLKAVFIGLMGIGILAFAISLRLSPARAWSSFVINHFYFMSLSLGGLFFASINWITGAMWIAPMRRISEALTAYLPLVLIGLVILYFGIPDLYLWSLPANVQGDLVLEGKAGYLSTGFFMVRNILAILIWFFFAWKMVGNSLAQDLNSDYVYTAKNRVLSAPFLILFAVTFTMASFDLLMSLDPHWFSTMFGVYCFSGLFYSTLAAICFFTLYLESKGMLRGILNENHLHDLGKYMFAFTVFWAYIGFSQFMLIWYANLPEETGYYLHRFHGQWFWISAFLLIGKFLVPFFVLLPRDAKRNRTILGIMSIFMLISQWIDVMWMVQPEFSSDGPIFGWVEIGITLGFVGLFCLAVFRFFAKNNIIAIGDPRLIEAVYHHHQ